MEMKPFGLLFPHQIHIIDIDEKPRIELRPRHERNDHGEREGGMQMGQDQAKPDKGSGQHHIDPPLTHLGTPESVGDQHAKSDQEEIDRLHGDGDIPVEQGDDHESDRIVGHGQKQQEGHGRVACTEDHTGYEPRQCDIRRRGDAPAPTQAFKVIEALLVEAQFKSERQPRKEDNDRTDHAAQGGEQGSDGFSNGVETPARKA